MFIKYLVIVLVLLPFEALSCIPTDGTKVNMTGTIEMSEINIKGKIKKFKSIKLKHDQCFKPDRVFLDTVLYLDVLQPVVPSTISLNLGQQYVLNGEALHWHTKHHYTKVLFSVSSVKTLTNK
ncbi:DUF4431 domain-containing protein [Pseudoalteromonas luteoviolacea]|uniref:DUF4431 domain-containing protein n=1 Tax=Pseudoalteromonas luteoviolacea TaxID=43657 RepID=UPI001B37447E|nr:DUF4431 domain-containing protein [Pseudoalteromonas luteoviolacea]